ncbi:MFS transporter [Noviherbaspirillum aerium]|uniref:MFS transporter n=1 Tax=Noviherbaspirillum aerium TaxID=2588497 RepID=UPI00124D1E7A|nr:MFS transporter [Noviherbaspirillum aerium]
MTLIALILMMVLAHIAFTGGRVALTLLAIDLQATPFQVGLIISLLAVIPMLFSVHAGRWTDRTGVMRPTLIAMLMLCAGSLLAALLPSLAMLCGASVLLGSGFMVAHLAINNAVGRASTPESRTHAFSMLALGFSVSTVLGPVISGLLIDAVGHRMAFLLLALFPVAGLLVLYRAGRDEQPLPQAETGAGKTKPRVMDLLGHAPLRAVFVASGLLSMAWDLFTFMVPIQGARIGLSASTIGLIMGTFGVGTFVVRLAIPRLMQSVSRWGVLVGALGLTSTVYLLFPLFTSVPVLLLLAFILGLGLGSALPTIMSLIHDTAPSGRTGEAVGVRSTLINTSQTVLPTAFGALGAVVGTIPVFWTLAAVLAWGAAFARRRQPAKGGNQHH